VAWGVYAALAVLVFFFWRRLSGKEKGKATRHFSTYFLAAAGATLTISMVLYPEVAFQSAQRGLEIWWTIVFPALLPFFIGSEILMGLGVVHFMGVLLEPLMRPVFNVPGVGSFVMAMGLASGYPIGSILTARLRSQKLLTKAEAERLMSFTNTADPLFMAGAVAVGMFKNAQVGVIIMLAHYISSLAVGLIMRFHQPYTPQTKQDQTPEFFLFKAFRRLREAREEDGRPLGKLLGDAIRRSVNTLLLIGGFIILFSVIIKMLTIIGFVKLMTAAIGAILTPFGLHPGTLEALVSGLFEITIGTQLASQAPAPLTQQLIAASTIIAWSGISVHAQVAAMIQETDLNIIPYLVARVIHASLAGVVTAVLMLGPGSGFLASYTALPVFLIRQPVSNPVQLLGQITYLGFIFCLLLGAMTAVALVLHLTRATRVITLWRRK